MSLKQFYTELKKGLTAPAYLIYSEDAFQVKEAMLLIKNSLPKEELDFKFHSFDLESTEAALPLEKILDVVNTAPFMGGRQTVTVEGIQKLKVAELKVLEQYLADPSPSSALVMLYTGKLKKTSKDRLKQAKAISISIGDRDIPVWIRESAAQKGIEFSPQAIERLIGIVGNETGLLSSEIEKLAMGGIKKVEEQDIDNLVKGFAEHGVFELTSALKAKNAKRVMDIYHSLSQTQEPYALLGVLNWHYGQMKMSADKREKAFGLLNEADYMTKSSGGAYPLEHLLSKLLKL